MDWLSRSSWREGQGPGLCDPRKGGPENVATWSRGSPRITGAKDMHSRDFLVVQWLRLSASTSGGTGSLPGQGTKIPCATLWPKTKQILKDTYPKTGLNYSRKYQLRTCVFFKSLNHNKSKPGKTLILSPCAAMRRAPNLTHMGTRTPGVLCHTDSRLSAAPGQ